MGLQNTKTNQKGFTIVELLIVIVVIGILAAITIVAFNGIQNRGKAASAQSLANSAVKKAEAHNTIQSTYPAAKANFADTNESTLDNPATVVDGARGLATAFPTDEKTVAYVKCSAGNSAQVIYRDAVTNNHKAIGMGGAASGVVTAACA